MSSFSILVSMFKNRGGQIAARGQNVARHSISSDPRKQS